MTWTADKIQQAMDQMVPPGDPDDPRTRKRLRILKAATEHFTRHGYRKANMSEIAHSAGVAKGTLYLYFKTKSDLLIHAIAEEKRQYMSHLLPILTEELPAKERMRRWLTMAFVITNQMPLVSRLLRGDREIFEVLAEMDADLRDRSFEIQHGFIAGFLEEAARPHRWTPSELQERTQVLMGLVYSAGVLADERARQGLSLERFGELLASIIVDGIAAPSSATKKGEAP
jgi:AcrR family transcriptional regulator